MIPKEIQDKIKSIWDDYVSNNKKTVDTKGNDLHNIDNRRVEAIQTLNSYILNFLTGEIDIAEFKTLIDSFNKQNNFWGFTSIKGQMFFNLLIKTSKTPGQTESLTKLLKNCITKPRDIKDALKKIEALDYFVSPLFKEANDKRKTPNPGSICYFLSYFWQIQDKDNWPIMYSSMVVSFTDIGLWKSPKTQRESYETFFKLNEEVKILLTQYTGKRISNWDAEHSFWNYRTVTAYPKPGNKIKQQVKQEEIKNSVSALKNASFDIKDYLMPVVANLTELGSQNESSNSGKGSRYEKTVCEVFKQLGFTIQYLGQGTGREPDLIAIHKEDSAAFIIDAKAYANGYIMGASDERAIREYISHYCPKLQKDGIKKIGFLIVSNSFRDHLENFINDVTWKTDIKRFSLITSDALLHLLAYKNKDQVSTSEIIEALVGIGSLITAHDIIQNFDDI